MRLHCIGLAAPICSLVLLCSGTCWAAGNDDVISMPADLPPPSGQTATSTKANAGEESTGGSDVIVLPAGEETGTAGASAPPKQPAASGEPEGDVINLAPEGASSTSAGGPAATGAAEGNVINLAPEAASSPSAAPVSQAPEPAVTRHWGTFADESSAKKAVTDLKSQGIEAGIEHITPPLLVTKLRLTGYSIQHQAEDVARHLRDKGIDAVVVPAPGGSGYEVAVGTFALAENTESRRNRLTDLGYKNVKVEQTWVNIDKYNVVSYLDAKGNPVAGPVAALKTASPDQADLLVFSAEQGPAAAKIAGSEFKVAGVSNHGLALDDILLEGGWLTDRASEINNANYGRMRAHFFASPNDRWDLYAQARLDWNWQNRDTIYHQVHVEPGEMYVRYRGDNMRLTLGNQLVLWGRLDGDAPTDKLSTLDVTRLFEDNVADRRRPSPAVRLERFEGNYKFDFLWQPIFRGAEMPAEDSIWSPYNKVDGRALFFKPDPLLAQFIRFGRFKDDTSGTGDIGIRMTHTGRSIDYSLTAASFRNSAPTYDLNNTAVAAVQQRLLQTGQLDVAGALGTLTAPTFIGKHPRSWLVGGDLNYATGSKVWRAEAALMSDVPVFKKGAFVSETVPGMDWGVGSEFYPGDSNIRVIAQLTGRFLFTNDDIIESKNAVYFNGQIESTFAQDKWRARFTYNVGLDRREFELHPEIAYIGKQNQEWFLSYLYFSGDKNTFGGYYEHNNMALGGWRYTY